jgi:hypothetical protein
MGKMQRQGMLIKGGGRVGWESEWNMDFKKRRGRGTEELILNTYKQIENC